MNLPVGDRLSAPTARPHCSLGQRPRSLSHNGIGLKARNRSRSTHCARPTAWDASFAKVLGRCPRLHCGWAVGPEMRQAIPEAIPGSCPTINAALWLPASLRMTAFGAPSSLGRPVCKLGGNAAGALPHSKTLARPPKRHPFSKPLLIRTVLGRMPALPTGKYPNSDGTECRPYRRNPTPVVSRLRHVHQILPNQP